MEYITILGASGSIGSQTLSILKKSSGDFVLVGFSIGSRTRKIASIVKCFPMVKAICIGDKNKINYYKKTYPSIKFFSGDDGLLSLISVSKPTMVINALVGFVGLKPTLFSLEHNLKVALANKEALVVGGELVNNLLNQGHGKLYPIDSEHSALWKCLKVDDKDVDKLIITASGGAFRKLNRNQLENVAAKDALAHPTWRMGKKITIDCATMVNKSFEIIEAYYLFGYKYEQVNVLLHDESHIHSLVRYNNGLYRAEINHPDMRNPIKFAIYEGNIPFQTFDSDDYHKFGPYHFHEFDINRYPMVAYAKQVIDNKGIYGCVYNASNEIAVYAFLEDKIKFLDIEKIINKMMSNIKNITNPTYEELEKIDKLTRNSVRKLIAKGEF